MKTILKSKKGQALNQFTTVAYLFVFAGVILGVGTYVNEQFGEQTFSGVTTNRSTSIAANDTWYTLGFKAKSVSQVANYSDVFPASASSTNSVEANWTTRDVGQNTQVKVYTNSTYGTGTYNVTAVAYTEAGYLVTANSTSAIANLSSWLPIIAVVLAAALVVGLLMMMMVLRR